MPLLLVRSLSLGHTQGQRVTGPSSALTQATFLPPLWLIHSQTKLTITCQLLPRRHQHAHAQRLGAQAALAALSHTSQRSRREQVDWHSSNRTSHWWTLAFAKRRPARHQYIHIVVTSEHSAPLSRLARPHIGGSRGFTCLYTDVFAGMC